MRFHKPRIRVTQIGLGMKCEMMYYLLKTVGPVPPSGSMTTGSGVHKAAGVNFIEKASSGLDAPVDVCCDAFNDYFKEWLLDTDWESQKPDDMHKKGIKMVKAAHEGLFPPLDVASEDDVEKNYILDCGDFEISGTVDLELPEKIAQVDFKTGRNMWSQAKASNEVQGFLYPLISEPHGNGLLIPFSFLVVTHAGRVGDFPIRHPRSAAQYIVRRARKLLRMVESHEEPSVNTGHYLCSERYCGWRSHGKCPLFPK